MKKVNTKVKFVSNDEMLPEYDLKNMRGGVRGKYYKTYRKGHTVRINKNDGTTIVQNFKLEEGAVCLGLGQK